MFTTNHNREHCQIRTKPEVCAVGTWGFQVIREGSMEREAFELDQRDVVQVRYSPGWSRMSESSRVEKTKFIKAKVQVCVGMKQQMWIY